MNGEGETSHNLRLFGMKGKCFVCCFFQIHVLRLSCMGLTSVNFTEVNLKLMYMCMEFPYGLWHS